MKAIRVSISFNDWSKVEGFMQEFSRYEDTFTYLVDNTTFIVVTTGECGMAYARTVVESTFDEECLVTELK